MSNRPFIPVLITALLGVLPTGTLHAQLDSSTRRNLLLDDYGSLHPPESTRISPDGQQIAYVVDKQVFVVAADGGEPRLLTDPGNESWEPRWSADGQFLYLLSDRDGSSQLWRIPFDDPGEALPLTDVEFGVSSINFSPDQSRLLLEMTDDELRPEAEDQDPQPYVVTRRQFKQDSGDGYITAGQSTHLYVYDVREASLTQLTSGDYEEKAAAWSPDGRSIVFVSNRDDPDATYANDLWIVATDSTDEGQSLTRLTNDTGTKQSPAWSPDGDVIAYVTAVDGVYGQQRIAVIPVAGGEPTILTASLDRWVTSFEFSAEGDWIYFNYHDSGAVKLARVHVRDGRIDKIVEDDRVVTSFDIGSTGDAALVVNNRNDMADVYLLEGKGLVRLTDVHRDLQAMLELGNKSRVSFDSADGTVIDAFITTPPAYDAGRAYPAILHVHGGPVDQFTWGFDFTAQYFAAKGYLVIQPNPRGSTGRGQAFINAIYRSWGITDYDDVIASVDFAVARGIADPDRLVVTGYSYGGYMTNVVITRTNRFAAAASGAGHSLIEANFGHDMYQQWYSWELGSPWDNRERYDVLSPLLRVANVETPTLFLGGRVDWNVPILNAELFYQALKVRGIGTELVVYPEVHHGGWPEEFEKDYLRRVVAWFDKHLAGE